VVVLSVTRHRVADGEQATFLARAREALDVLRSRPGFVAATVGRSTDDAHLFVIATTWDDVGSFRRALSSFEARVTAVPLLSTAIGEPTAFERLLDASDPALTVRTSDRAPDADDGDRVRG
jgi:heme-degrading monooxygenase HmoA